jgi:hypothetical protein
VLGNVFILLNLGINSELLLKVTSFTEADLSLLIVNRVSIREEVDRDQGKVEEIEPDVIKLEAEKINSHVHCHWEVIL